jgi:hypothetical protein
MNADSVVEGEGGPCSNHWCGIAVKGTDRMPSLRELTIFEFKVSVGLEMG